MAASSRNYVDEQLSNPWVAVIRSLTMGSSLRESRSGGLGRVAGLPERQRDLIEDDGIVDGGGHAVLGAVGDLLHGPAQDLARSGLGQALHHERQLEGCHGPDALAHAV